MNRKLLISLIASITIYLILVILSFIVNQKLNRSIQLMEYYVAETQQIRSAGILLRTIESDVHSYLISGNKENIVNLKEDFRELDKAVEFIEQQTDENPLQQQRIEELKRLKQRRRALFQKAMDDYHKGRMSINEVLQRTQVQSGISQDMLSILREIDNQEQKLLSKEKLHLHKLQVQNYVLDFAAGLGPLIIAFFTIFSLVRTLNEGKRIKQQLEVLNKDKDKFISIIGHDLKGPAGAIKLMAELLVRNKGNLTSEQRDVMLQRLLRATDNHLKLLEDILTWARSQTNKIEFNPIIINLHNFTEEILLQLSEVAFNKGIKLENKISSGIMVRGDENMLRTVIRNLVQNALKFTGKGGKISLSSDVKDNLIEILVADTGIGMPPERLNNLFKIGAEVSTQGTEGEPGTGLGLIISKEFVEKNNGTIRAESEQGKGSIFTITLPKGNYNANN